MLEKLVYLLAAATQGQLVGRAVGGVIGKTPGHLAEGGIALDADETFKGAHIESAVGRRCRVDVKHRPVGVSDFPHQHHADHHRVSLLVIDLDRVYIHIAHTQ